MNHDKSEIPWFSALLLWSLDLMLSLSLVSRAVSLASSTSYWYWAGWFVILGVILFNIWLAIYFTTKIKINWDWS